MNSDKIEILLKEYETRGSEIAGDLERYHRQTNFVHLYVSLIIAIGGFFIQGGKLAGPANLFNIYGISLEFFFFLILVLVAIIGFYLFVSILDSLYITYISSARRAAIEKLINKEVEEDLLVWDSKIIPNFFSTKFRGIGIWINSPILVGLWSFLILIIANGFLCFLCMFVARKYFIFFFLFTVSSCVFHICQWFLLHTRGIRHIWSLVLKESFNGAKNC